MCILVLCIIVSRPHEQLAEQCNYASLCKVEIALNKKQLIQQFFRAAPLNLLWKCCNPGQRILPGVWLSIFDFPGMDIFEQMKTGEGVNCLKVYLSIPPDWSRRMLSVIWIDSERINGRCRHETIIANMGLPSMVIMSHLN